MGWKKRQEQLWGLVGGSRQREDEGARGLVRPACKALPLAHGRPCPRLAEKKASIGYTYEDSTVAEVEKVAEKPEEEESPAEEESNSDEDEVIPDIGGVPSLSSPPPVPGQQLCV